MPALLRRMAIIAAATLILVTIAAAPASAALSDCAGSGGSWWGSPKTGVLSNGRLDAGFCRHNSYIRRVNVQYYKSGGGTVTLRFGWRIVSDSYATTGKAIHWD